MRKLLLTLAALLFLCVVWNLAAPPDLCWLGFWKGTGVAVIVIFLLIICE